jgi:hypothetical protein
MDFFTFTKRQSEKSLVLFLALPILSVIFALSGGVLNYVGLRNFVFTKSQ